MQARLCQAQPDAENARRGSQSLFAVHVMHDNAGAGRRHGQPFLALERAFGVFVAALPVLAHRRSGKLVVLGVTLVGFLLIDDVQNRNFGKIREFLLQPPFILAERGIRNLVQDLIAKRFPFLQPAKDVSVVARAR